MKPRDTINPTTAGRARPAQPALPRSSTTIRADLNLEKWPLWQPARAVHKRTRTLRRDLTTAQGAAVTAEVTIGCVDRIGTLTTEDQKTCYALIKLWEEQGKPDDIAVFSLRQLARILAKH